jgi:hypothetical protein
VCHPKHAVCHRATVSVCLSFYILYAFVCSLCFIALAGGVDLSSVLNRRDENSSPFLVAEVECFHH